MQYEYSAQIAPDPDGGFLVSFPDVPEAITSGPDLPSALHAASEALGLALRGYVELGRPLPPRSAKGKGLISIPVDPADALKLAVIEAFGASGLSKTELAARLGKSEAVARRILNPDHPSKLSAMEDALAALGKNVVVSVLDAA
ncbi:MAG: type II toxin-antitoxin system HicB family antitoxin [Rhizobiaceae bacterium]|nr:type II toxin-antitoxin system HicB family antitoxin [Rhizobiaceae bacterium]